MPVTPSTSSILTHCYRELNIFLNPDFFASFKTFAARPPVAPHQSFPSSPYTSLVSILKSSPHLSALRIRVAESTGPNSLWAHSAFLQRPDGIPIGAVLRPLLSSSTYAPLRPNSPSTPRLHLLDLQTLELDAFSDIGSLLRLAPNLQHLKMNLPNGYALYTNVQLLDALKYTPHLTSLSYSAESLSLREKAEGDESESESEPEGEGDHQWGVAANLHSPHLRQIEEDTSAELIRALAKILPRLESLDLHSRSFEDGQARFPVFTQPVTPEVSYFGLGLACATSRNSATPSRGTYHTLPILFTFLFPSGPCRSNESFPVFETHHPSNVHAQSQGIRSAACFVASADVFHFPSISIASGWRARGDLCPITS